MLKKDIVKTVQKRRHCQQHTETQKQNKHIIKKKRDIGKTIQQTNKTGPSPLPAGPLEGIDGQSLHACRITPF